MLYFPVGNRTRWHRCVYNEQVGANCAQFETIGCRTNGIRKGIILASHEYCSDFFFASQFDFPSVFHPNVVLIEKSIAIIFNYRNR